MMLGTRHVGIVVSNLEVSIKFYQALGFELEIVAPESGDVISSLVGLPQVKLITAKLNLGKHDGSLWSEGGFRLELIEYIEPKPSKVIIEKNNVVGKVHLCFTVQSLDEANRILGALGHHQKGNIVTTESGARRCQYLVDPDGYVLEIIQELT